LFPGQNPSSEKQVISIAQNSATSQVVFTPSPNISLKRLAVCGIGIGMATMLLAEEVTIDSNATVCNQPRPQFSKMSSTVRFDDVYRKVHPDVLRFVARRLIPPDYSRAEEITHDAFTKLWVRKDSLPNEIGEIRAWLFTVARNDLLKSNAQGFRSRELSVQISPEAFNFIPDPLDGIGTRSFQIDLASAWHQLTPAEQEIISLTYWEELSSQEAGQVLGISDRAYRLKLHRTRRKLKKLLEL
jgi:RNA polymerase sigma-70 factor, ECF subfamily